MIKKIFKNNKSALDIPEVKELILQYQKLETENLKIKNLAEDLVVVAFAIAELRNVWRLKFGLATSDYNGGWIKPRKEK